LAKHRGLLDLRGQVTLSPEVAAALVTGLDFLYQAK